MGGALGKGHHQNKQVSPEPSKRGTSHHPQPRLVAESNGNSSSNNNNTGLRFTKPDDGDKFLEDIANEAMSKQTKSFHNPTTFNGFDLRFEVESADLPAQEVSETESSDDEDTESAIETAGEDRFLDDGYYSTKNKAIYHEKPKPKADYTETIVNWSKGGLLGSGGFGKVFLGFDNDNGTLFAVKVIALGADNHQHYKELQGFKQEVAVMKKLDHENIVRYCGTIEDGNELNIFLEYVPGGSISLLLSKFGSFNETLLKRYTRQILLGLEYLHSNSIIHRDIKGANILVTDNGVVKLADFGASKQMEALMTTTHGYQSLKGTPYWMAPEVIKQSGYGRQADIWSVGCTVIEMATGKPPFHEFTDQVSVLFHIASSNQPPPIPSHLSPVAQDFLLQCFARNPSDRPIASELLGHPFLSLERKVSGGTGFSPKPNHHQSFSEKQQQTQPPAQHFVKHEDPRQQQPQATARAHQRPPDRPQDPMENNLIEEPTWTWGGGGGDKRNRFRFSSSANDVPPPSSHNSSFNSIVKRGDSMVRQSNSLQGDVPEMGNSLGGSSTNRHKRAISVTPEKTSPNSLTQLPLDANAPPSARLSMRRHSALEAPIRDPADVAPSPRAAPATAPGDAQVVPSRDDEGSTFSNHGLTTFNNSFTQSFNSINGMNISINPPATAGSSTKRSPKTPRKEVADEEAITKFLTSKNNELLQKSTRDFNFARSQDPQRQRSQKTIDKLPEKVKTAQVSPKKFSDMIDTISDEATNAKFKKKAPGTTTTTIVLNATTINGTGSGNNSAPGTPKEFHANGNFLSKSGTIKNAW